MESYDEQRVTVYGVMFGELMFLDSYTTQLSKLHRKPNFGELVINGNSPILSVVKLWRVSRKFYVCRMFL